MSNFGLYQPVRWKSLWLGVDKRTHRRAYRAESFMGVDDTPENRTKFEASFPRGEALKMNTSTGYVANAAVYLCSDDAAFVSGICMPVDGAATVYAAGGTF